LPCRSETRAATMPRSRANCDKLQPALVGRRHYAGQVRLVSERQPDHLHLLRLAKRGLYDIFATVPLCRSAPHIRDTCN
jgi:hypothetical protein